MPDLSPGARVRLDVRRSPLHGWGVFAGEDIDADRVVEICATLFVPAEGVDHIDATPLAHYVFPHEGGYVVVMGNGMLYNHAVDPNCRYSMVSAGGVDVQLYATVEPVPAGDELTINYSGIRGNAVPMWWEA